jgi:general secretion pathway protein G
MKGFTLIELLIAVAVVAMLASVAMPLNELVVQRAKEQDLRRALRELRDGIDAYKQAADEGRVAKRPGESGYPRRLQDLVSGVEDEKNPKRARIHFLRRIPRDPFAEDNQVAAAESWGIRSYASPPEAPRDGEDVFDVFSLSNARGLNGWPYKDW